MVQKIKSAEEFDQIVAGNELVFVDFFANWCGPCKMLGPVVEKLSEKVTDVKFAKVDCDELPDLAARFNVASIPAVFVLKNGTVASQGLGCRPEAQVAELIDSAR